MIEDQHLVFVCFLVPTLSHGSQRNNTVSKASIEAEYKSLAHLVTEITWLQSLLAEVQALGYKTPVLWCDNMSNVLLSGNHVQHARIKHMILDLYFVCE